MPSLGVAEMDQAGSVCSVGERPNKRPLGCSAQANDRPQSWRWAEPKKKPAAGNEIGRRHVRGFVSRNIRGTPLTLAAQSWQELALQ